MTVTLLSLSADGLDSVNYVNESKIHVFCTLRLLLHNTSGKWRAAVIDVEVKVVKNAFAAGYV